MVAFMFFIWNDCERYLFREHEYVYIAVPTALNVFEMRDYLLVVCVFCCAVKGTFKCKWMTENSIGLTGDMNYIAYVHITVAA